MVEFRGIFPSLRLLEFYEASRSVLLQHHSSLETDKLISNGLGLSSIINDQFDLPVCAYVHLPNDDAAAAIARRCSLVKSILQVWGDSGDMDKADDKASAFDIAHRNAETRYEDIKSTLYISSKESEEDKRPSWRMNFRRIGRGGKSGLDLAGKRIMLDRLSPLFRSLSLGLVDLHDPQHNLLYLEDWHLYHEYYDELKRRQSQSSKMKMKTDKMDTAMEVEEKEVKFVPR